MSPATTLHKLLIGSLGTLAVITRLNFRTFALPQAHGGHLACFSNLEGASAYRDAVENSGLPLSNLETLSPELVALTAAALRETNAEFAGRLDPGTWCVFASFEGNEAVVPRIARDLQKLAIESGALTSDLLDASSNALLGGALREAFDWLRWASPCVALFRIVLPRINFTGLAELLQAADRTFAGLRPACARGRHCLSHTSREERRHIGPALSRNYRRAHFLSCRCRPGAMRRFCTHPSNSEVTRKCLGPEPRRPWHDAARKSIPSIPQNIFAPGRFVGGI